MCEFEDLKSKVLSRITGSVGDEKMVFETVDGEKYELYHEQD